MHQLPLSSVLWIIVPMFFLFTSKAHSDISINCGSTGTSAAPNGQTWLGDFNPNLTIKGSSTRSSVIFKAIVSADEIPYKTARISRSQFSYVFRLNPGQKIIHLHFHPSSYNGFETFKDLFGVEAGSFTLLSNFSASITSEALAVKSLTKEYCLSVDENGPLNITFSAEQLQDGYAFVNGIEIVSVPESLEYCHTGDVGVQVVGQKSLVYVGKSTALELVHRRDVERDPGLRRDDDLRGIWAAVSREKANRGSNVTWKVSVDLGFRYLVRLYFSELGLNTSFSILIDHNVVYTDAEILKGREDKGSLRYKNYMVMANGRKQDGKRDILISLQSRDKFVYAHRPLEGFEVFKLSNHDNSLASPNPLPSTRDSPSRNIKNSLSVLGHRNAIASVAIVIICMINIVVHMLRQYMGDNFSEVDKKLSPKDLRYCRRFSLAEVQLAARNFDSAYLIGKGGFGKVYKGLINNGEDTVAVKRLKLDSKQGKREFLAEIETLSELRHVNLVSLIGYCNEQREMILVYECMPNGSLADHIYKLARKNNSCCSLSWEQRLNICIGAGRGLDYLHTGHGIIHRDVKASNILLDENFVAKVSDFGLVKTLNLKEFQSQVSTNPKGTFGYFDPDYFSTRTLTKKSDTYSFGVMLLEVLCGRPAVDPWVEEDKRSLTMWARDNISRGQVEQIIAPCLRGKISPDSLKAFVGIVERCLLNEPKKRPTIAHVVINLEFALEQQKAKTSVSNEIARVTDVLPRSYKLTSGADVLPYADEAQRDNARSLVPNRIASGTGLLQNISKSEQENANLLLPSERTGGADVLPYTDRTTLSVSTRQLTPASSNAQNVTSILKKPTNSRMFNAEPSSGEKDGRKTIMHKISRLLPWNATSKRDKSSKRKASMGTSLSAPLSHLTSNKTSLGGITFPQNSKLPEVDGDHDSVSNLNLRIFSLSELKAATKNFAADTVLGQGGFGKVYKGRLQDKSTKKNASVSEIAVKRLIPESVQGFKEWMAELNFLGKLSHPNLVKLLGYCWEDRELLLVYEYMQKGSLDNYIFGKFSTIQPLPWNSRLKILIGAARGLAYLHTQEVKIIYRDFKASNVLLDESYQAKLADFGLAKSGPNGDRTHVSTQVMGTHGYAAPEYIATGHLYVKSDVYSFGVILAEMLTGRRAFDRNRPSGQQNLVDWIKAQLSARRKSTKFMDPHLEGNYPSKSALQILQLARNCLENNPKARPEMKEVVEVLERLDSADNKPGEPRVRFDNPVANALPQ